MGIDAVLLLPPYVRVQDVADVIGILSGCPVRKHDLDHNGAWAARVDGVSVAPCGGKNGWGIPQCAHINWTPPGQEPNQWLYHFEGGKNGERCLMPRATDETGHRGYQPPSRMQRMARIGSRYRNGNCACSRSEKRGTDLRFNALPPNRLTFATQRVTIPEARQKPELIDRRDDA